ncbi:MAG: PfkB family carbohydrate kinase [Lachnospiraceae bacterium]
MGQYITKEEFQKLQPGFKNKKLKIVLCHGVFDLVHPGHIIHFQEAKKLGDLLVVSITAAQYVRKGPGRPYFDDEMRVEFLKAIEYIDYVMISEGYTGEDIIETVKPDLYVKGREYEKTEDDITGKINQEMDQVRSYGGEIAYTSGAVFSSTKLINNLMPVLNQEMKDYLNDFNKRYTMEAVKHYSDKISQQKVLVIGDAIIDKYTYCNIQGLMSKDMGYSARYEKEEEYLGGSLAIARHIASFTTQVTVATIIGNENPVHSRLLNEMSDKMHLNLVCSEHFPTIVKQRFITTNEKREEFHKVFSVNNLPNPMIIDAQAMQEFIRRLKDTIEEYDLVVVCDFGHGLITKEVIELVEKKAHFLAINCQTNSSNYGLNVITKYHRADAFTLDQKELKLAYPTYDMKEEESLECLAKSLGGAGWLTRGALGAYGVSEGKVHTCPAFTLKVKDTIGAGDAFYAVASLYLAAGASVELGTFMGNIAGALAANIVGNKESIDQVNVLKYASTLLNI